MRLATAHQKGELGCYRAVRTETKITKKDTGRVQSPLRKLGLALWPQIIRAFTLDNVGGKMWESSLRVLRLCRHIIRQ
ncbi:hypothetical protein SRHO_G00337970 [Serrasalmus rhombeus]